MKYVEKKSTSRTKILQHTEALLHIQDLGSGESESVGTKSLLLLLSDEIMVSVSGPGFIVFIGHCQTAMTDEDIFGFLPPSLQLSTFQLRVVTVIESLT